MVDLAGEASQEIIAGGAIWCNSQKTLVFRINLGTQQELLLSTNLDLSAAKNSTTIVVLKVTGISLTPLIQ
jgi:hypothetical protein